MPPAALRSALALLATVLTAGGAPAQPLPLRVDCAETHQTVRGLGTSLAPWKPALRAFYQTPAFEHLYLDELGASALRIPLEPAVLPEPVEDPQAIRFERFRHTLPNVGPILELAARLRAARPGAFVVVASVWSPPGWMKTNGSERGGGRLRPDRRAHFARYLAEWVRGLRDVYGLPLDALSIQNEPAFSQRWESCVYSPAEYAETLRAVARELARSGLRVRLIGPEHMTTRARETETWVDALMSDPETARVLGAFASHGFPSDRFRSPAAGAGFARLLRFGRELWLTETSGEPPTWNGALDELAGKLHNALVYGSVSLFTYWQIAEAEPSPFALTALATPTPKLAVARHWFRAVRPGARRVGASAPAPVEASAFLSRDGDSLAVVLLNRSGDPFRLALETHACPAATRAEAWRSTASESFAAVPGPDPGAIDLPGRSLVTWVQR